MPFLMCSAAIHDSVLIIALSVTQVGDIVSVIDMPPKEDTGWWRGKHGFQVHNQFEKLAFGCRPWLPLFNIQKRCRVKHAPLVHTLSVCVALVIFEYFCDSRNQNTLHVATLGCSLQKALQSLSSPPCEMTMK